MGDNDNIHLSAQLTELKDSLAKNTLATEKVLWIISDPDTGLVKRVGDIGVTTSNTVKEQMVLTMQVQALTINVQQIQERQVNVIVQQELHNDSINELLKCAADAKEAKKPWTAIGFGLLEKVLWVVAVGVIGYLTYLLKVVAK